MEVVDPSRLNDRMRVWFVQAVTKEEAFARFLRDRCDGLRKSISWTRILIANYGVSLMVLVWTVVSYAPDGSVPKGIQRCIFNLNPWSPGAYDNWTVIK
ncbi:boron transporter 1-like protein, partial [Tanacetum coccineum]